MAETTTQKNINHFNCTEILETYADEFQPPVCNKVIHKGQLVMFFIIGPNERRDYHIEEGEEIFYMQRGEMSLKIMENNKFRIINIKEGEMFLLPKRILHSPRRHENSYGFVIERTRNYIETDGFLYFEDSERSASGVATPIHEVYDKVKDLQLDVKNVVQKASDDMNKRNFKKTKRYDRPVVHTDSNFMNPFKISEYLESNEDYPENELCADLFGGHHQSQALILSNCNLSFSESKKDNVVWCFRNSITLTVDKKKVDLKQEDFYIVTPGCYTKIEVPKHAVAIKMSMSG